MFPIEERTGADRIHKKDGTMMGNRRQPFGYRMQFGEIVVDLPEAELVKMIFQEYLLGASFQSLADILQAQDISYEEGKRWNKNMVARILGDKRYQGQNGYPKLIDVEVIEAAAAKRATKAPPVQKNGGTEGLTPNLWLLSDANP